jgi:hypothetical protein
MAERRHLSRKAKTEALHSLHIINLDPSASTEDHTEWHELDADDVAQNAEEIEQNDNPIVFVDVPEDDILDEVELSEIQSDSDSESDSEQEGEEDNVSGN